MPSHPATVCDFRHQRNEELLREAVQAWRTKEAMRGTSRASRLSGVGAAVCRFLAALLLVGSTGRRTRDLASS
jgi:hypothetical protein